MQRLEYFLLDVFTDQQFGGNPLAVFPNADDVPTETMQSISNELNLSESTFIQPARTDGSDCTVRIFTPLNEMPMAGHPTIGTAYAVLRNQLLVPRHDTHLILDEGVGQIRVDYGIDEGRPVSLMMHQPLPSFGDTLDQATVATALSLSEDDIARNHPIQVVSCGVPFIMVPLNSLDAVRRSAVRTEHLAAIFAQVQCCEFFVFTMETERPNSKVHCRMFAPRLGVAEDAATGSAHGPLGSYLVRYNLSDGSQLISEQGFEMGRPSFVTVKIETSKTEITQVLVGGKCVEVGSGVLQIRAKN